MIKILYLYKRAYTRHTKYNVFCDGVTSMHYEPLRSATLVDLFDKVTFIRIATDAIYQAKS